MHAQPTNPPVPALALAGVGVRRGESWLLRDIAWRVPVGASAALLGANGAGKSTLLRVLAGYEYPTEGTAEILGRRLGATDVHALRRRIRVVAPSGGGEGGRLDFDRSMTVLDVVATARWGGMILRAALTPAERDHAAALLAWAGIESFAGRAYGTLSTGERTRTLLARALAGDPQLLLLDEPTHGLDLPGREQIVALLASLPAVRPGVTTVVVTHTPEEIPPATTHVLLLAGGHVAASGTPAEVFTDATLSAAYGLAVDVRTEAGRWYWRAR